MKEIDFSRLKVQMDFEVDAEVFDLRKEMGNNIRRNTADIGLDELARQIYFSTGPVEIPEEYIQPVKDIAAKCFIVPVQESINNLLSTDKK